MRLDKFVCRSTQLDQPQARAMIAAGKVEVNNGIITDPTQQVHESNYISLAGQRLTPRPPRYIMLATYVPIKTGLTRRYSNG